MRKALIFTVVMGMLTLYAAYALAETKQDNMDVNIEVLPALAFNVIEDTLDFQVVQGQTGIISKPFSMQLSGGGSGAVKLYAASISTSHAAQWPNFVVAGNAGLLIRPLDNFGAMYNGDVEVRLGPVTNGSEALTTGGGFTFPQTTPLTINANMLIDASRVFSVFGTDFTGTINAQVQFLAELL